MLKIKDNVNLDELEKFGFKKERDLELDIDTNTYYIDNKPDDLSYMRVYADTREMVVAIFPYETNKVIGALYDLIKADLIEKVEDK